MGVLSGLKPEKVFYYFEEISKIPHGSGNVERISDYLAAFARERGFFCIQDEWKNIIVIKEAAPGYEDEPAVILQGHMDMVAVSRPECGIDMAREGLKVKTEGDFIYAECTSLGGDDGIAVAYALALLDSDTIRHPRLEIVITVDEEVGMDGAREIDLSVLTGRRMLNLDSETEGVFLTSCAGGAKVNCAVSAAVSEKTGIAYEIMLGGLRGGHSGDEINKERGNSNMLFGRLLWNLADRIDVGIVECAGGLADNAIPRETRAVLVVDEADSAVFAEAADTTAAKIKDELSIKDPDFKMQVRQAGKGTYRCAAGSQAHKLAAFLCALPNGIQAMSADMPGLVETSLNLGILKFAADGAGAARKNPGVYEEVSREAALEYTGENPAGAAAELSVEYSVRSSVESAKNALIAKLKAVVGLAGGRMTVTGDYPGWKYRADSPLREKMVRLYEEMYGKKPEITAIHAGLECGLLGNKIQDLDCVSIGPDMRDIHTTEERLSISSAARVWDYLVKLLEEKD